MRRAVVGLMSRTLGSGDSVVRKAEEMARREALEDVKAAKADRKAARRVAQQAAWDKLKEIEIRRKAQITQSKSATLETSSEIESADSGAANGQMCTAELIKRANVRQT